MDGWEYGSSVSLGEKSSVYGMIHILNTLRHICVCVDVHACQMPFFLWLPQYFDAQKTPLPSLQSLDSFLGCT